MDPRYGAYCRYYEAQSGGALPVFRGGRQSGEGLGDILRGIFRFLAPIALRGISTFAGHTLDAHQKGATFSEAAKSALNPTLRTVVGGVADQFRASQSGSGNLMALYQAHRHRYAKLPYDDHDDGPPMLKHHTTAPKAKDRLANGRFKRSRYQAGHGDDDAVVAKRKRYKSPRKSSAGATNFDNFNF